VLILRRRVRLAVGHGSVEKARVWEGRRWVEVKEKGKGRGIHF
jgi:hypothetical protein